MKRYFLTGGTGFIGTAVTRLLVDIGAEVGLLVRNRSRLDEQIASANGIQIYDGDLANTNSIQSAITDFKPDTLIHLGWAGITAAGRDNKIQLMNLSATIDLVQAAIESGVQDIIGLGSQAEYGRISGIVDEDTCCKPTSLYGACKLSCCCVARQLCQSSETRFAWLRLFSSYGPNDTPEFMIPSVMNQLLRKQCPSLTGGEQIWDYLYVGDAANAIRHVAMNPLASGIFNLGSGTALPIKAIVEQMRDLIDKKLPLGFGDVPYGDHQVMHLQANVTRLRDSGWSPQTSLQDGLQATIEWHKRQEKP